MAVERTTTAKDVVATFVKKLHAQNAQLNMSADQYRLFIDFPDGSMYSEKLYLGHTLCRCVISSRFNIFLLDVLNTLLIRLSLHSTIMHFETTTNKKNRQKEVW